VAILLDHLTVDALPRTRRQADRLIRQLHE
jgi:hypothetical protein